MTNIKYNPNAELRIISTLLMLGDYKSIHSKKAMLQLTEDCFYNQYLRDFFVLIKEQYDKGLPFDELMILDLTNKWSENHHKVFDKIINHEIKSLANFDSYIESIVLAKQLRLQLNIANIMINECNGAVNNQDASDALQNGLKEITSIALNKSKQGKMLSEIGELYFDGHYDLDKIKTNIPFLDQKLEGGIQNRCLVTICGDTGVGKTYFALYLMQKLGNDNPDRQSLYFNLEMAEQHNWKRLIGIVGGKPFDELSQQERIDAHIQLIQHPITIYEESHSDIDELITIARIKALEKPLSVIVVDYIGLVTCKKDYHRHDLEQVSIAKRLASLAIELNCIVIATSQTNRNPQNRSKDDRCPYMSDAADSSGNYKSAEIWIGIDRPELYNDNQLFKNKFIAKLRKNRNGLLFDMAWDFNIGTFGEIDCNKFFRDLNNQLDLIPKRNRFKSDREVLDE